MKIIHKITLSAKSDRKILCKLQQIGVKIKGPMSPQIPICTFEIAEDDEHWPEVHNVLAFVKRLSIQTRTEFSIEEIVSAEWVDIYPTHFAGYPMPKLDGTWRNISFNAGEECPSCGIGREQKAPIHLKGEPKLGRNHFMGIFWTYDIFARNEVFDVLSPNGITGFEADSAIHYKKKVPLTTIKQLKVSKELAPGVIDDNLTRADVERMTADNTFTHEPYPCGHVKYIGLGRGMYKFSRSIFKGMPDLVKTHEWFGVGHEAIQCILASAKFAKLYVDKGWRGLNLSPIELV